MKNLYVKALIGVFVLTGYTLQAQDQNVGIGTMRPDQSAVLDIQSVNKGLLIPRMSLEERNNIKNPANGLLIFQTDEKSGFYFYEATNWKPLTDTEAKSVAADPNDWSLSGNDVASTGKALATASSYIGTPAMVPINFKIGGVKSGVMEITNANTAYGFRALSSAPSGTFNIAFGANALRNLSSGQNNFGIGTSAMESKTSGSFNMALGTAAMIGNISGSRNTAIGNNAGQSNNGSDNLFIGYQAGQNETGSNYLYIANSNSSTPLLKGQYDAGVLKVNVKPQVGSNTSTLGFLAIGDFSDANFNSATKVPVAGNGYRLYVQDGVLTEKVKVALKSTTDWADYVFEPEYQKNMLSLEQVEAYAKENKHLPNVPSADEMATQGLDVGQTSKMFMEKIEELTLYMIELNKEVKALKAENEALKAKLK